MTATVIQHVFSRLYDLGIRDVFGVPGDYAFPIEDDVCSHRQLRWIGDCNELNAAYAADGYARIRGMAALSTTFGVGELSALNGIAGSFAESLPIFHLVGLPESSVQDSGAAVHHTFGDGNFTRFYETAKNYSCAYSILTPENCVTETERLIAAALRYRKPVYMGVASDHANMAIVESSRPINNEKSDPETLVLAVNAIAARLSESQKTCVLPGILVARLGLRQEALDLINAANLPYATMFMDKSVLDETNPNYMGIYSGRLINNHVQKFVENCDCVLNIGALLTDFNTGAFTADLRKPYSIFIDAEHVKVGDTI